MEKVFKDISTILEGGSRDEVVINHTFHVILDCTTYEEAWEHFSEDFLLTLIKYTGSKSSYNEVVFKIFINLLTIDSLSSKLSTCKDIVNLIHLSVEYITDKQCLYADKCCMFLSNFTRQESNAEFLIEHLVPFTENFNRLVTAFTIIDYNPKCPLDQLAMVFCNLSQTHEFRKLITQTDKNILQKLIPFMNHDNVIRRNGIIGVVHNLTFDSSIHNWLLSDEVDLLPKILLPLAGPEEFDDEDNDKLPLDLQYLPDTKTREPSAEIRKQLLETLNQLCATKTSRQYLRDHNAYIILRELHKWEADPSVLLACENVVDVLIRTEEEIGIDHLKTVDIPEDLEEKFKKLSSND